MNQSSPSPPGGPTPQPKKNRGAALELITKKIISSDGAVKENIYGLFHKISRIFLNEKTHQLYELALTTKKTDVNQAQQKIEEALKLEPDHWLLKLELSRMFLANGDCLNASQQLEPLRKLASFDEELNLATAFLLDCDKKLNSIQILKLKKDSRQVTSEVLWKSLNTLLDSKEYLDTNDDDFKILRKIDPDYPELDYFEWKYSLKAKQVKISLAQSYVVRCRNLTSQQMRKYIYDPFLCRRVTEVAADLRKMNKKIE